MQDAEQNTVAVAVSPGRRRWRSWLWRLPLLFVAITVLQVLLLRFIDPPFTAFMAARQLEAVGSGDFGFRVAYDWRDLDDISRNVPLAMIASEDQNFANHNGFDFQAIEKARAHNERAEERARKRNKPVKRIRGASTISQQTAKNLFLWKGQGVTRWARKGLEVWYTLLIETLWPKSRIIEVYVNTVELGNGVYGAQAAARTYFRKDANRLAPAEAARMAAVLPNPRRYSIARPGPYVQRRSNAIQRQMRYMGGPAFLQRLD
ncbi:monofunctional biosynthetic peptidoglycan transglycosylase [Lysobacter sp. Root494]|uniref:monofunctional biosynthetic peptidoglycan transglycosylase n=1 Tax=Lysobacter sp. Root494 TaxID=1736549 RepID=UPI0006F34280|nr:monofunctional biosynthetic peptidoglycan transglycosylase [Lysobacter sp. Root494]KQY51011.1 monofunctional biosynthetic peptidoglycan transglycosylase [Lysobacter sp. Root494]